MNKTFIIVNSHDSDRPTASQNRLLAIARGLCESGARVYWFLLASEFNESIIKDPHYKQINFIYLGNKNTLLKSNKLLMYLYRLWLLGRMNKTITELKQSAQSMIFYAYDDRFPILKIISIICKKRGMYLCHEITEYPYLNRNLRQRIDRFLYMKSFVPLCDHIFVISTALQDFYQDYCLKMKLTTKVSILNIIVEQDRYYLPDSNRNPQFKDIVYIGTLYGTKDGVYDLIKAFSIVRKQHPESRLVLAGDLTKKERLTRVYEEIGRLDNPDSVVLTGLLKREEIVALINSAYCLALARPDNEQAKYGFPTKLGEYLATGRPVVITSVGDIPLYLKDGINAYISAPSDPHAFAQKLRACLSDELGAKSIGEAGRVLVNEVFNPVHAVKVIVDELG